jgi:hypothetical protein
VNKVWGALTEIVDRHREFAHTTWAMPTDVVDRLERLAVRFDADGHNRRVALFQANARLSAIPGEPYEVREERLRIERRDEVVALFVNAGIDAIRQLAEEVQMPITVGWAAGASPEIEFDDDVLLGILGGGSAEQLALGYVGAKMDVEGTAWLARHVGPNSPLPAEVKGAVLAAPIPTDGILGLLAEQSAEVIDSYWRRVVPFPVRKEAQVGVAVGLTEHGRPSEGFFVLSRAVLGREPGSIPFDTVEAILMGLLTLPSADLQHRDNLWWEVGNLLDYLDNSAAPLILRARLEFVFTPIVHDTRPSPALSATIRSNPDFFVELVASVYPPDDGAASDEITENQRAYGIIAYQVLQEWSDPPGVDGSEVDGEVLRAWVLSVRDSLIADGRTKAADEALGRLLAFVPTGEEGWPAEVVRGLVEQFASKGFEEALVMSKFRSTQRGGWGFAPAPPVVGVDAGRAQEEIGDRWPRTAAMLRDLGELFSSSGRSLDRARRRFDDMGHS